MTRRTIMSLARNNATAATMKTLIRDLYADDQAQDEEPARSTVSSYIQMLQREYLIEELPCWNAPIKAKNRMRVKPKRYFTDPSLAAAALGLTPTRLLTELPNSRRPVRESGNSRSTHLRFGMERPGQAIAIVLSRRKRSGSGHHP